MVQINEKRSVMMKNSTSEEIYSNYSSERARIIL